jgi:CRISPR-associated protein Cmr1
MNSITFTCEVVTPMFLAGADGIEPDLRPPSIKGAMRFWWRAMHGNYTLSQLQEEETRIFGGGGENAKRSSFQLRAPTEVQEMTKQDFQPLLHHTGGNNCISCNDSQNLNTIRCKKNFKFKSIIGGLLNVKISATDLEPIKKLFILTCLFGGFGRRSRRGFGSVRVIKNLAQDEYESFNMPVTLQDIIALMSIFSSDYQLDDSSDPSKIFLMQSALPERKYPYIEKIIVGSEGYTDAYELLERIGKASHKYKDNTNGSPSPRFSSPTYISVLKINANYYPVITSLHLALPDDIHDSAFKKSQRDNFQNAILNKSLPLY